MNYSKVNILNRYFPYLKINFINKNKVYLYFCKYNEFINMYLHVDLQFHLKLG